MKTVQFLLYYNIFYIKTTDLLCVCIYIFAIVLPPLLQVWKAPLNLVSDLQDHTNRFRSDDICLLVNKFYPQKFTNHVKVKN